MGELKSTLETNGFAIVPGFLTPQTVQSLRTISQDVLDHLSAAHRAQFKSTGSLCNFGDHPDFADIVTHPGVAKIMADLDFDDFRWLAGYLISKPGNSPPLFWHQDWWGWSEDVSYQAAPLGLGFMYYLTDTKPENGCLRIIPGSHRQWHELHGLPEAHGDALSRAQDTQDKAFQSHPDQVDVAVNAGDLVIMDSRVLHSAHPNSTSDERSLLTLWYLPEYTSLPDAIRARLHRIFSRTELDVDAGDSTFHSPLDWPEAQQAQARPLFPDPVTGQVTDLWQRSPDRSRMA